MSITNDNNFYHDIIDCLVGAIEAKDVYTNGHSQRVADMSVELGKKLNISKDKLEKLHMAAHLHDVGKIGIPDYILNKNGRLSNEEWILIKKHPSIGYDILCRSEKLKDIGKIVLCHHERWDGRGYPNCLKEREIPIESRVIAVCDTIDAMTSKRPYRKPISWEICRQEIENNKWKQFDPMIVEVISDLWDKWKNIYTTK